MSCIGKLKQLFGDKFSDRELMDLSDFIDGIQKKFDGDPDLLRTEMNKIYSDIREMHARSVLNEAQQIERMQNDRNLFMSSDKYMKYPDKFIEAKIVGVEGLAKESGNSIRITRKSIANDLANNLIDEIENIGVTKEFFSGKMDKEVFVQYYAAFKNGKELSGDITGQTAKALRNIDKQILKYKNMYGAQVDELDFHLFRQNHDAKNLREVGFEQWQSDIRKGLDESVYKGMKDADIRENLLEIYNKVVDGSFMKEFSSKEFDAFSGKGKTIVDRLQRRMNQRRKFLFKDGEAAFEYHSKYGKGTLAENFYAKIEAASRDVAVYKNLGGEPMQYMDRLFNMVGTELNQAQKTLLDFKRQGDNLDVTSLVQDYPKLKSAVEGAKSTADIQKAIEKELKTVDGSVKRFGDRRKGIEGMFNEEMYSVSMRPTDNLTSKFTGAAKAWQYMSRMGSAVVSTVTDWGTAASVLRTQTGDGFLSATAKEFGSFTKVLGKASKADRLKVAKQLNIMAMDLRDEFVYRFQAGQGAKSGHIAKMTRTFSKLNLLGSQSRLATTAHARLTMLNFAEDLGKSMDSINPRKKATLDKYGITPEDWTSLSKFEGDMDGLKSIDLSKLKESNADLFLKMSNLLNDSADHAVPKANSIDRYRLFNGIAADTPTGAVLHLATQFMSFPVAMIRTMKTVGLGNPEKMGFSGSDVLKLRELNANFDLVGITQAMVAGTILGYGAMSARSILNNKTPPDPLDPRTISEAMIQGGAMGIYGDFLGMLLANHYGMGISRVLGPTVGTFEDMSSVINAMMDPDKDIQKKGAAAFKLLARNAPGANLWFAKAALDTLFVNRMMETMDPSYMDRVRKSMEGRGQEFIVDF